VVAAFYGHGDRGEGFDVTDIVKRRHASGRVLHASNELFGDPAKGKVKTLLVDVEEVVTFSARENTNETINVPSGYVVVAAFYGDDARVNGRDVTDIVKRREASGQSLRASNKLFGDPLFGKVKTLFVDVGERQNFITRQNTKEAMSAPTDDPYYYEYYYYYS